MSYFWFMISVVLTVLLIICHSKKRTRNEQQSEIPEQPRENGSSSDLNFMEIAQKKIDRQHLDPKDSQDTSNFFYGKKVVLTGSFGKYPIRNHIAKALSEVGCDVNTAISKKTDYVILGDNPGWRKLEQIEQLGIETLSESDLETHLPNLKSY